MYWAQPMSMNSQCEFGLLRELVVLKDAMNGGSSIIIDCFFG